MWTNIRFLVRNDLRRSWLPTLLTGFFYSIIGLTIGGLSQGIHYADDRIIRISQEISRDLASFGILSSLGFALTKEYLSYYRTDFFSQKLAFYRRLPITGKEIVTARYLVLLATLPLMSICYYIPFYLVFRLGQDEPGAVFLGVLVMWTSFSLLCGAGFVHLELGYPGRKYFIVTIFAIFFCMGIITVLGIFNIHLISGSFYLVRKYAIVPPLLFLAAGIGGAWAIAKQTIRRLEVRDLL